MNGVVSHVVTSALATIPAEPGLVQRLLLRDSAGTIAGHHTDQMYVWLFWFCVFWFVLLMGLMCYFVIRYRRKPGQVAPRSSAHNTPLEITWTIIPTILLVIIFYFGFKHYLEKVVSPGHAVEMQLTGFKWNWRLVYPNGAQSPLTASVDSTGQGFSGRGAGVPVFYVPAEVPIRFRMISQDVMHAFWIPDFRIKMDVLPNRFTSVWFQARAPRGDRVHGADAGEILAGVPYEEHWVYCAEYCGTEHSEMAALLRVIPEDKYNELITSWANTNLSPVQLGEMVWRMNCASCHTIDGGTNTGPTWQNMYGYEVEFTDGTRLSAEEMTGLGFANYVRESTLQPAKKIVKGYANNMQSFAGVLSEEQITGVIEYMKTLSDRYTPPAGGEAAPAPADGAPAEGSGSEGAASGGGAP